MKNSARKVALCLASSLFLLVACSPDEPDFGYEGNLIYQGPSCCNSEIFFGEKSEEFNIVKSTRVNFETLTIGDTIYGEVKYLSSTEITCEAGCSDRPVGAPAKLIAE